MQGFSRCSGSLLRGAALLALATVASACAPSAKTNSSAGLIAGDAATRVYVPPGSYDEFYSFLSGGFSGQLSVYGIPSGRLIKQIPVFSQFPENGYGYNTETKAMLNTTFGFVPWDDSHHTELSQTDGVPDGRWLFLNANNTPRVARIDLKRFETTEILQVPNASGGHASPFITPDSKYVVSATRFSVPIPQADVPIESYKQNFKGTLSFITASVPGKMDIAFQIMMPGYDYDLGHAGKGPSDGWFFFTTYNSEQANTKLEVNASQADKDYIAAVNYRRAEECIAAGKAKKFGGTYVHNYVDPASLIANSEKKTGVTMLYPAACDGLVY
jgi:nitrous-oxide reductase